jgi:HK97 family phage prohead protease
MKENTMTDVERRFASVPVEIRAGSDGKALTIGGYAGQFNKLSQNLGGFVERYAPTFWSKSRGDGWPGVMARYNHDDNQLLGTTGGNTLRLGLDDIGLVYDVNLDSEISYQRDLYALVTRGDVRKSSQAFIVYEEEWSTTDQGFPLRTLVSGKLVDVAPVNTPAYEDTSVGTRSIGERVLVGRADIGVGPALRSFAEHFEAEYDEVRKLAEANELVRFFKRSDGGPAPETKRSSQAALAKAMSFK